MTRAAHAESGNRAPPALPARDAHGQISQRPDAMLMQHGDNTGWQPVIDRIAHLRLRDRKRRQDIQRPGRGLAVTGPFAHRALEQPGQICTMPAEGETGKLPPNSADHAARRLAAFERLRAITFDRLVRGDACVPRAQRRQGRGVRKGRGQRIRQRNPC